MFIEVGGLWKIGDDVGVVSIFEFSDFVFDEKDGVLFLDEFMIIEFMMEYV